VRWAGFSTDQSKIRAEASTMIRTRWIFGLTAALLPLLLMSASISEGRFVGMRFDNGVLIPNPPPYDPNNPNTGLQKAFPTEIVQPADNPTTPEKVELGKLLFFDPILSDDNTLSCAHCHHPHLGFSDGLPRSRGRGGKGAGRERTGGIELTRGAPSLWNTVYNHRQFWDGRAAHLEEQARMVITTPEEVNADPAELVRELKAIPNIAPCSTKPSAARTARRSPLRISPTRLRRSSARWSVSTRALTATRQATAARLARKRSAG
jgi:hypothetical protein